MATHHLSCGVCRLRVRADSPAIAVLEGQCPICATPLTAVVSVSEVIGFRSFDLGPLADPESDERPDSLSAPPELRTRRKAAQSRDSHDAGQWSDDGGSMAAEAASPRPAPL